MKKFLIVLLLLASASGQDTRRTPLRAFSVTKTTARSGAAEVVTVQKPTTASALSEINFLTAFVSSTVADTVQASINGTAATTTTLAVNSLTGATINATAFSASNVGAGTVISPAYDIAANTGITLDLSAIWLRGNASANNLTLTTTATTGTVKIIITGRELP